MTERLLTQYGIVLRDDRGTAAFVRPTMTTLQVDIPSHVPLSVVDELVGEQLRDVELPERRPVADPLNTNLRPALLPLFCDSDKLRDAGVRPKIGRLTINISNACNLWCSYCYADKGLYHAPRSFMSPEVVTSLITRLLDIYDEIGAVQFFGGEPLMNLPAIEAACEAFSRAAAEGRIAAVPQFAAVTNGTLSSSKVLDVLQRWGIELTISHDGPRDVHDANRPTGNGRQRGSSYDLIAVSMERYSAAGVKYDVECTYNSRHISAGVTVRHLLDFFHEMTGQTTFHIAPAFLPRPRSDGEESGDDGRGQLIFRGTAAQDLKGDYVAPRALVDTYRDAARYTMANITRKTGPRLSLAVEMATKLAAREPGPIYCPAFFDQLSVAVDGAAYPCFMFIGDPQFRLGNLLTDALPLPRAAAVMARYSQEFGSSPTGTEKWFEPINSGCVAGEYIQSSSLADRTMEPIMEAIAEEVVLGVAHLDLLDKAGGPRTVVSAGAD